MNFLNSDFNHSGDASRTISEFRDFYYTTWTSPLIAEKDGHDEHENQPLIAANVRTFDRPANMEQPTDAYGKAGVLGTLFWNTLVLAERTAINYRRNLLAYGVRAGMYCGMGFMLA